LHRVRSCVLLEALDPPRDQSFLHGWVLGEDERDCVPVAVADEAALEQRVDEPFRRLRADLPLRAPAPTVAQVCANLLEHLVELVEREALALDRVPGRSDPEAERVALGLDALGTGAQRPERVRVLGDLSEHGSDASRCRRSVTWT